MFPNNSADLRNGPSGPPVMEPARYEFQFYLSDDVDEAVLLRTAQEALLAEHPDQDALMGEHVQSVEMDVDEQMQVAGEQEQEHDGPIEFTSPSEALRAASTGSPDSEADAMDVDSGAKHHTSPPREQTPPETDSHAASSPDVVVTRTRRARPVKIVVAVPTMTRKKQKTYEVIDLESDDELSIASAPKHYSPRRLRKRTQVSLFLLFTETVPVTPFLSTRPTLMGPLWQPRFHFLTSSMPYTLYSFLLHKGLVAKPLPILLNSLSRFTELYAVFPFRSLQTSPGEALSRECPLKPLESPRW